MLRIIATRGGVCAADDLDAHDRTFSVSNDGSLWRQLREACARIVESDYLPYSQIWVVSSGEIPVAVIADHWPMPQMVHSDLTLPATRLSWSDEQSLIVHFHLHNDLLTPPGDGKVLAECRLADELLETARRAEAVADT